jgi:hypothetical protein
MTNGCYYIITKHLPVFALIYLLIYQANLGIIKSAVSIFIIIIAIIVKNANLYKTNLYV